MSTILPFARPAPGMPGSSHAAAFIADAATATAVSEALPGVVVRDGGLGEAIGALSCGLPPIVVVDVAGTEEPVAGIAALARAGGAQSRIIAIGAINDIALYRALRAAGAAEYLVKPVTAETLAQAARQTEDRGGNRTPAAETPHRLFVCGARGGAGATTFAVNAAWHLTRRDGFRVMLIDLDLALGTVALALDVEPSHGLSDILENPDRVDALFVAAAATRLDERLSILAAEEPLGETGAPVSALALKRLFAALAEDTDCIVADVPRHVALARPDLFTLADRLVLVAELSLAGARDTARLARLAMSAAPGCPISLIANKCGGKGEINATDFARSTRLAVDHRLPWDPKAAATAANAGTPIACAVKTSPLGRAIAAAADALVPVSDDTGASRSLWKKLMGGR